MSTNFEQSRQGMGMSRQNLISDKSDVTNFVVTDVKNEIQQSQEILNNFYLGKPGTGKAFRLSDKDREFQLEYCKKNNITVKEIDIDKELQEFQFEELHDDNPFSYYSKQHE